MLGAALGAASGAVRGKLIDFGICDEFMKDTARALQPRTAGLFVLIRSMTADKAFAPLKGIGGTVIKTSSDETNEAQLRAALAEVQSSEQ